SRVASAGCLAWSTSTTCSTRCVRAAGGWSSTSRATAASGSKSSSTDRLVWVQPRATIGKHVGRQQTQHKREARGYQDQVVEVADHGNEIRDQVDRAERIGDDDCRQGFGVPRCTRIAHRQADDLSFSLQPPRADLEALEHAVLATVLSVTAYGQVARATVAD